jgi:glycosyltransferase involved in cell wall biosynthesis
MLRHKGIFEFVEAVRLLRSRGLAFRAALVGRIDPGNPASIPAEQLRRWADEGVIDWWGWEERMETTYAKAHIVCLPSYYREGVPMSLVEAAASGLPIVATDVPGCREIVHDHVNGLLVPPRDGVQLADALQLLIENPELQSRFGSRGREIASDFSNEHVLDEMMIIYRDTLHAPAAGLS